MPSQAYAARHPPSAPACRQSVAPGRAARFARRPTPSSLRSSGVRLVIRCRSFLTLRSSTACAVSSLRLASLAHGSLRSPTAGLCPAPMHYSHFSLKIALFTKKRPSTASVCSRGAYFFYTVLLYIRLGNFNHKIRNGEGRTGVYAVIRLVIIASVFVVLRGNINFTQEEL